MIIKKSRFWLFVIVFAFLSSNLLSGTIARELKFHLYSLKIDGDARINLVVGKKLFLNISPYIPGSWRLAKEIGIKETTGSKNEKVLVITGIRETRNLTFNFIQRLTCSDEKFSIDYKIILQEVRTPTDRIYLGMNVNPEDKLGNPVMINKTMLFSDGSRRIYPLNYGDRGIWPGTFKSKTPCWTKILDFEGNDVQIKFLQGGQVDVYDWQGNSGQLVRKFKIASMLDNLPAKTPGQQLADSVEFLFSKANDRKGAFIRDWLILGPWPGKRADTVAEELASNFQEDFFDGKVKPIKGMKFRDKQWQEFHFTENRCKFEHVFGNMDHHFAYAYVNISSPVKQEAQLLIGSSDSIEIWLNGNRIWRNLVRRSAKIDNDKIPVVLQKGWNSLLIKIYDYAYSWRMPVRITDRDHRIINDLVYLPGQPGPDVKLIKDRVEIKKTTDWSLTDKNWGPVTGFKTAFTNDKTVKKLSPHGYRPGVGNSPVPAGRFGWIKGDGLLDCSMTGFGEISKNYIKHHAANSDVRGWQISCDPPYAKSETKGEIRADWTSVDWKREYIAEQDFYSRKKGTKINFGVTYSLAMPGIILKTNDSAFRIDCTEARRFNYIALPLSEGVVTRKIKPDEELYNLKTQGKLSDNWILLWGSEVFPDIPVLIILEKNPGKIIPVSKYKRLTAIDICRTPVDSSTEYIIFSTPFGIQTLDIAQTNSQDFIKKIIPRCKFWSKTLLAYITGCQEAFRIDEKNNRISVIQNFTYRILRNEWNSQPLKIAPYPPVLSLVDMKTKLINLSPNAVDLECVTKYGPFKAVIGSDQCQYDIPLPPTTTRIPLKPLDDNQVSAKLAKGIRMERYNPEMAYSKGEWYWVRKGYWLKKTRRATTASSWFGQLPFLFPFMDQDMLQAFRMNSRDHLIDMLDDIEGFKTTNLYKAVKLDIGDAEPSRPLWFKRKEPYTGSTYLLNFRHSYKGDDPSNYPGTFTDQDWGNGRALYGIYLLAKYSDSWDVVRKNWPTVQGAYRFFEVFQDWALMSVGNSERGHTWCDTSCYGGYTSFMEMARELGKNENYQTGAYLFSRHCIMRLALFFSGTYMNEFYDSKPWLVQHHFDEINGGRYDHMGKVPKLEPEATHLLGDDTIIRRNSLYSLTAEGINPEFCTMLFALIPEQTDEFVKLYNQYYPEWPTSGIRQLDKIHACSGRITAFVMFLLELWDKNVKTEWIGKQLANSTINKISSVISRRIKGSPELHYLQALIATRKDPIWLEDWNNTVINRAVYDRDNQTAEIGLTSKDTAVLQFGIRQIPQSVTFGNDQLAQAKDLEESESGWLCKGNILVVKVKKSGKLKIKFKGEK